MDPKLTPLFEKAFDRAPALRANERIQAAREALAAQPKVRSYEVVVPPEPTLEWLRTTVLPRMVYHLESLGLRPPQAPGVFVTFFMGEELVLVHGRDLFAFAEQALGMTSAQMLERWGTGERRTPIRGDEEPRTPLRLPLPGPEKP
jgi:hypothetical protein